MSQADTTNRPRWATPRETAAHLRISLPTLYRRVKDGRLPKPADLGGTKRWDLAAIDARLTAQTGDAA